MYTHITKKRFFWISFIIWTFYALLFYPVLCTSAQQDTANITIDDQSQASKLEVGITSNQEEIDTSAQQDTANITIDDQSQASKSEVDITSNQEKIDLFLKSPPEVIKDARFSRLSYFQPSLLFSTSNTLSPERRLCVRALIPSNSISCMTCGFTKSGFQGTKSIFYVKKRNSGFILNVTDGFSLGFGIQLPYKVPIFLNFSGGLYQVANTAFFTNSISDITVPYLSHGPKVLSELACSIIFPFEITSRLQHGLSFEFKVQFASVENQDTIYNIGFRDPKKLYTIRFKPRAVWEEKKLSNMQNLDPNPLTSANISASVSYNVITNFNI